MLQFEHLSSFPSLVHFVTTRAKGQSQGAYSSLNMGFHTADNPAHVLANRQSLASQVGIPLAHFCVPRQVHGKLVEVVTTADAGKGATGFSDSIPEADGLVTQAKDVCLMVLSADCGTMLFYDPKKEVIGATHAGWRGAVQQIGLATLQLMENTFGTDPKDVLVGYGPCISVAHYEVGDEVVAAVEKAFGNREPFLQWNDATKRYHLDLEVCNLLPLMEGGIPEANFQTLHYCTYHHEDLFFSSRRDQGITGRMGTGIMLRNL